MTNRLFAFFSDPHGERPVGVFERHPSDSVTFTYFEDTAGDTPLSLSLPLGGDFADSAAENYLENLLPDRDEVKERWGRDAGVDHHDVMAMLSFYGEDVAGAVTLTPQEEPPRRDVEALYEADTGSVAARIASLRHDSTSWIDPRQKPRMSLAGQQGKFSVSRIRDRWFWPTYETPSTHIIKPAAKHHELLDDNEASALRLAHDLGIATSAAEVIQVEDQRAFITKRWDRTEDGFRVHAEDMAQSHGINAKSKYKITAPQVAKKLREHGADTQAFVEQLAFNTYLWNADAHSKNYSVLLDGDKVELAPLYDAVPTRLYPSYNSTLAMPIGNTDSPAVMEAASWRRFALSAGLDEDEVIHIAFTIRDGVAERYRDYLRPMPKNPDSERNLKKHLDRLAAQIKREPLNGSPPSSGSEVSQTRGFVGGDQPRDARGRYRSYVAGESGARLTSDRF